MSAGKLACESSVYLCEELIINILKRLPVKSLLRFMSVCKSWYSLIKTPDFFATHLSHQIAITHNQSEPRNSLYLENERRIRRCFIHCDNESFDRRQELFFPEFPAPSEFYGAGTCNGIVCFGHTTSLNAILWNPSLRNILHLDIPHTVGPTKNSVRVNLSDPSEYVTFVSFNYRLSHGIGFESCSYDHKFVSIATSFCVDSCETKFLSVYVYSLNLGAWKVINTNLVPMGNLLDFSGASLNGVIYSLVRDRSRGPRIPVSILTFNLADETFGEMPIPGGIEYNQIYSEFTVLMTLPAGSGSGENIAYLHVDHGQILNLWVMEINGVKESWRLAVSLRGEGGDFKSIVNASENGEILVDLVCGSLAALNPTDWRLKLVPDNRREMECLGPYMETLVLL